MKIFQYMVLALGLATVQAAEETVKAVAPVDTMTMVQDALCRQVLVTCEINGVPMRMMLDTGATNTVLHSGSLSKLKNPRQMDTSHIQFSGNAKERPDVYLLNLIVAGERVRNHPVMVLSLEGARSMMAEQIDGIVGMDILGALPFTFDVASGKLHWGLPEGPLKLVPLYGYKDGGNRLFMNILCDGKPYDILLDSGSTITRLPQSAWPAGAAHTTQLSVSDVNEAGAIAATIGTPGVVQLAPGVRVEGVTPVFCGEEEKGILGMDVLGRVRLIHVPSSSQASGYFFIAL